MKKFIFTLVLMLSVSLGFAQKNILVEELTGTWCQWCPSGIYYGDSLCFAYDNVIFVAIHCSDVMENSTYYNASGLTAAPSANIGRKFMGQNTSSWFSKVQQEMQTNPKADMSVTCTYNEATRQLTATVTATALENISGDYRLAAILVEDAVTGPAPTYNQSNSYSGGAHGVMGGFENLPNPVPAERIAYDHVGRQLLSDYNGAQGSFPSSLAAGQTASYEFTYTLPGAYDHNFVRVIGALVAPDGSIDNAARSLYLNGSDNAAPIFTSTEKTESYVFLNYIYNVYFHDTDDKDVTLTATTLPAWLTLEQYDNKSAALYGVPTEPGDYEVVLQLSDGDDITEQTFTIEVNEPLSGAWEYVGERAFSDIAMRTFGTCADSQGNIYVFGSENDIAVVYEYDGNGWTKLGNTNMSCGVSWNGMDIDSNDNIYIAFNESGTSDAGHVLKWDGSTWTEIGSAFGGAETTIHLDPNDVPYLLIRDTNQSYMGVVLRLENNTWTPLSGTGLYAPDSQYGLWHSMAIDSQGVPYVSYSDYMGGNAMHVVKFENGAWVELGQSFGTLFYYQDIAINDNDEVFVAYCSGAGHKLNAVKFNGTAWETIGDNVLNSTIEEMKACMVGNKLTVAALNTGQSNYLSVVQYDGEWTSIGPSVCSESSIDIPVIAANGNAIVVAFKDDGQDGKGSCMQYAETVILYPPTDLAAEVFGNDNVTLTWGAPVEGIPTGYNVYRDDALIATATELSYSDYNIPAGTHHYTLSAVYPDGESVQVGPVTVETILGIDGQENAIALYPTIVSNTIRIESKANDVMTIYNTNGQEILTFNLVSGSNDIDVSALSRGIYFVDFGNGSFTKIVKL